MTGVQLSGNSHTEVNGYSEFWILTPVSQTEFRSQESEWAKRPTTANRMNSV